MKDRKYAFVALPRLTSAKFDLTYSVPYYIGLGI